MNASPARRVARGMGWLALLGLAASYGVAVLLSAPNQESIGMPPSDFDAREVSFPSRSGATIHGWFVEGQPTRGAVLLLHGVRANRLAMLQRARFLSAAGYAVLLIDFQAHGDSRGRQITFGALESRDAQAAMAYLREVAPDTRIGVIGVSMGGAAAVLAEPPLAADALVLEQVYPTIDEALDDRLRIYLGPFGALAAPLLRIEMSWHLGIDPMQLRPIDRMGELNAPVFVIAGEVDRHTTLAQSQALFAAVREPKQRWIVPGAAHVDLHAVAVRDYESRVLAFFERTLRAGAAQDSARSIPSQATSSMTSISSGVMQYGGMK
jgi:uncharacterized protein